LRSTEFPEHISNFFNQINTWSESQSNIIAIALVGSYARGDAAELSDVDLVIITSSPEAMINNPAWIENFGRPKKINFEDWGEVQSIRAHYLNGLEVEFGITGLNWLAQPIDEGTMSVIREGIQVVFERDGYLSAKLDEILSVR
jgi:hypothetical protein